MKLFNVLLPLCAALVVLNACKGGAQTSPAAIPQGETSLDFPFYDPSLSLDERINDLISRLSLEEKAAQMMHDAPGIKALGIPPYGWWNEALHGVGRSGTATVFPQAIGLGATFDSDLVFRVSSAISDEARAMHNAAKAKGYHLRYSGLTFWTPNINIFRDPRWGRGQETYGEDPFLTSLLGAAFVKGLQGDHPLYLKTAACAKHFAVHSGPEKLRHEFDAVASPKDLFETYLPAFEALVEADVEAVMCAYNSTNGEPCCSNDYLIDQVLRGQWGFKGHVLSDCWALVDLHTPAAQGGHGVVSTQAQAAALAVKSGVGLNCGSTYLEGLPQAVSEGLISEEEIDRQLAVLLRTRFKLGLFDPMGSNPYDSIGIGAINSDSHRALAREVAQKSIVMLKNDGVLPLRNDLSRYFVTGPNAANNEVLLGNYHGVNPNLVTILEGIAGAIHPGSQLQYRMGALLDRDNMNPQDWASPNAGVSDATIAVLGISSLLEGEEGESLASTTAGDRLDYSLPANQLEYLKKLREAAGDRPIIAVITGGSPMDLAEVHELADAVLLVWYPGQEGGNALADILFGKVSPSGRLPVSFPKSLEDLPPYEDYSMKGRTYKYMEVDPFYPFGFGLGYGKFTYGDLKLSKTSLSQGEGVRVSLELTNHEEVAAEEVVQLYVSDMEASVTVPISQLYGTQRIHLGPKASRTLVFDLPGEVFQLVDREGKRIYEPGQFTIHVGGSSPGQRAQELGAPGMVRAQLIMH